MACVPVSNEHHIYLLFPTEDEAILISRVSSSLDRTLVSDTFLRMSLPPHAYIFLVGSKKICTSLPHMPLNILKGTLF